MLRRLSPIFVCAGFAFAALASLVPLRAQDDLHLAAAADLVFCLEDLNAAFARTEPFTRVRVTTGSSGGFFAQIKNGAPYDLFLSADHRYPRELIAANLAPADTFTPYAVGRLVLFTTRRDLELSAGLDALVRSPAVRRLAIANPDHAPYGIAAKEALQFCDLWDVARPKLVLGENIAQTAQFVQTGHAEVGIVALSLVLASRLRDLGQHILIPEDWHKPLNQAAVLTHRGAGNPAARRYLAFLRTPGAREIFERFGFILPATPASPSFESNQSDRG